MHAPTDEPSKVRRTILVVDDSAMQRLLLSAILDQWGYAVLVAEHGRAALALLAEQAPDLILLDYEMPVMDGARFARAYASTPLPHAPLLVLSGRADAAGGWSCLQPIGILSKPVNLAQLQRLLQALLSA